MKPTDTRVTSEALRSFHSGGSPGRFVLLPEFHLIFVKNAKAGSSTLTLWLHRIYTGDYSLQPIRNIHANHAMPRRRDVGWKRVARMLDGDAFRFSFVRDPVSRVESAYLDKILRTKDEQFRTGIRRVLGLAADAPVGLDEFVDALEAQNPMEMDQHWRPQHLNLMHPLIEFDFIGRLETFDADLARLREMAGLPDAPVQGRNRKRQPGEGVLDSRPDLVSRIRDVYAVDCELYRY